MASKRRPAAASGGGGDLLLDVLTAPVLGVPRLVHWVAKKLIEEVERQEFDEDKLQGQLLVLQTRHELGEIEDEEYARGETALLERLNYIRRMKEED
ncbi:MAG: gas vesicle protein GvpG [Chloroflexi bacterium]|nr:gas vesicle protein GvpG [Chloroflexota bacterium]